MPGLTAIALCDAQGFRLEYLHTSLHPYHAVPAHYFVMRNRRAEEVGRINLRLESPEHVLLHGGHVGYGVHAAHRGNRYAARAVRLLQPVARAAGIDPLWITCDPENFASRRSCELAGAEFVEIVPVPKDTVMFRTGHPFKCRYRLPTSLRNESEATTI